MIDTIDAIDSVIRITENKHYLYRVLNIEHRQLPKGVEIEYTVQAVAKRDGIKTTLDGDWAENWVYFTDTNEYHWSKKTELFTGFIESVKYINGIKVKLDQIQEIMRKMGYGH